MPYKLSPARLDKIWNDSIRSFDDVQGVMRDERIQCLQDRRFVAIAGAMWENLAQQFANRPKIEVNKIAMIINRILTEGRNNPTSVQFFAKDGVDETNLADVVAQLFRSDWQDSSANEAIENAFEEAVTGGIGAFRLVNEYEDEYAIDPEQQEYQRIRFEPIVDADSSVFFDLNAKKQDKSDARECWVLFGMTPKEYERRYPGRNPTTIAKTVYQIQFEWNQPAIVYVAEYYVVDERKYTAEIWQNLAMDQAIYDQQDFVDDPTLAKTLKTDGYKRVETKPVKERVVRKFLMDGQGIIEDLGIIAGKCIPIIPMYGKRFFIENVERCYGHVRLAKDVQRLMNMEQSRLAEIASLSPIPKPIFTAEQIAGHQQMWSDDNVVNYPYKLINTLRNADGSIAATGPIGVAEAPDIPPALAAIYQQTQQDMQDVTGVNQTAEKIQSNVGGEAIKLILNQNNNNLSFIYLDNRARAVKRAAEIWLSMARELYIEEGRRMKAIGLDNKPSGIVLKAPYSLPSGILSAMADLSQANFDVVVDTAPLMSTRRAAMAQEYMGLLQYTRDPDMSRIVQLEILRNIQGEGLGNLSDWARFQLVQLGVEKATPDDQQKQEAQAKLAAGKPPTPQDQAALAFAAKQTADAHLSSVNAQTKLVSAQSDAQEVQAKIAKLEADTAFAEAQAISLLAQVDSNSRQQLFDMILQMDQQNLDAVQKQAQIQQLLMTIKQNVQQAPSPTIPPTSESAAAMGARPPAIVNQTQSNSQ